MDFFQIGLEERKKGGYNAYPDFVVGRTEDLMVRSKNFYAIWDEESGLWSTDEYDVPRLVDAELRKYQEQNQDVVAVKYMRSFSSRSQSTFRQYMSQIGDNARQLDEKLTFQGTKVGKKDYVSKRLPYELKEGSYEAWDEIVGTLYKPEERAKIEWSIGAIISGESKKIQKFCVLYGPPGAGKGTIINIVLKLFDGYITTFDAKALGSSGNQFAAAAFAGNPLVAIQHDGDLSKIEDNTTLNSIVSHEIMQINEKYRPAYDAKINAFLLMGTNKPVKITDAQSGLIRRLIDIHPSGEKIPKKRYDQLMARIDFELGAIAYHCLEVFEEMGKNFYGNYSPMEMMFKTNAFLNFIDAHYEIFEKQNGVSAKQAWNLYRDYCEEAIIPHPMPMHVFRAELGHYFEEFHERLVVDGTPVRSYYKGFRGQPFKKALDDDAAVVFSLDETESILDTLYAKYPAQYSSSDGTPEKRWVNVRTTLADIDTSREHFVNGFPVNHIVIDFDLKGANGKKSLERNLREASTWPSTYAELSRSGQGVHLHYEYAGDVEELEHEFSPGIEIKVYSGNSSLRRRLTKCNNLPIATISDGLPRREKKRVYDPEVIINEKTIRRQIAENLEKKHHPGTKPSIDFINHILNEAYEREIQYDVSDMKQDVVMFANNSTNKALECLKIVQSMRFKSEETETPAAQMPAAQDSRLAFFDIESYPNLFVVCWKFEEDTPNRDNVIRMINPTPQQLEYVMSLKLVGFYNRNYDNHMVRAAAMGLTTEQLYELSTKLISNVEGAKNSKAYDISWTDIHDYATKKQGLKKWQIELGLNHREMDIPWDKPVPEDRIMDVVEYCVNDVVTTEQLHKHLAGDYKARLILADLSGLTPNDTTAKHTAAIIFGKDKYPARDFIYTDLSQLFPGYEYDYGKSTYRDELVGEGGYVYAEPGLYSNVALLDVASMHPTSIGQLNLFGDEYTPRFMALVQGQLAIKRGKWDEARTLLEGKLKPYIDEIEDLASVDPAQAKKNAADLRYGLKIAINIVYGLTSAKFDNPFRDRRNVDNIVAKRGALFMVDLKHFVQEQGFKVIHIKTDSIKIPDATPEIINAVQNFAAEYGYDMEHEATYSKLGLVNDAVYVAKKEDGTWSATGKQFQHPYVFKKLFGGPDADISFLDLGETKNIREGSMFLDFGFHYDESIMSYIDNAHFEIKKFKKTKPSDKDLEDFSREILNDAFAKLVHVGRTGRFVPVNYGYGGGQLWRITDGKPYAVQGTKGHLWVDANIAADLPDEAIDYGYFDSLVKEGIASLEKFLENTSFASVEEFLM